MKPFFLILLFTAKAFCQENFGSLNSNYMPTNSVLINPSSMLDAKTRIDINIASFAGFFMNNMVYLENTSLRSFLKNEGYDSSLNLKINVNHRKYHLYNRTHVQGPSLVFSQGDHAFGVGLHLHSFTDFRKIPQDVIVGVATTSLPEDKSIKGKNISMASMTYGDMKISYAYTFKKKKRELFMGGFSFSKFFPVVATASKIKSLNAEITDENTGLVYDINSDNAIMQARGIKLISGFGLDLGFTYQRMLAEAFNYLPNSWRNNCRKNYYLYKIGISIMDIGNIKFTNKDTDYFGVRTENYTWARKEFSFENINVFNGLNVKEATTDDKSTAFIKKINKVRLPTCISVQGDYNAWRNKFYLNLTWVQRIPVGANKFGVGRANSLCITPRYETKFFEAALPLSLYEYTYPQIGLTLRFWFLTIGSDKLLTMFIDSDVYGSDFYFALKIPVVYHPKCRDGRKDKLNYYPERYKWRSNGCPVAF